MKSSSLERNGVDKGIAWDDEMDVLKGNISSLKVTSLLLKISFVSKAYKLYPFCPGGYLSNTHFRDLGRNLSYRV